jgi:AcrR family transcriptional regulator
VPKVVDHQARRREIAAALWRVVHRDGVTAASVRAVAAESGWSVGALRHYFSTQSELLVFAMEVAAERVRDRLAANAAPPSVERVLSTLGEVLPLDAERTTDAQVWLALSTASRSDPTLRRVADEAHRGLRRLAGSAIDQLAETGLLRADLDVESEVDRLHALIDGLAVHGSVYPRLTSRARLRTALAVHVSSLMRQPD